MTGFYKDAYVHSCVLIEQASIFVPLEAVVPEQDPNRSKADPEAAKLPKGTRSSDSTEPRFRSNFR